MLLEISMKRIDCGLTTHKSGCELNCLEEHEVTKKCCREIVVAVLNLRRVERATAKWVKAVKSIAQTAQHI
jgi:hypothetical protein